jgi:hypothetical protein
MKKIILLGFVILGIVPVKLQAQNIGINNTDPKAALDVNGGFRLRSENTTVTGPSVLLTTNRSHHVLIGSPVADFNIAFTGATENGQHAIITNTTLRKGFLVPIYIQPNSTVELIYSNGAWKLIGTTEPASSSAWGLSGNAGTDTSVNFIGTTDDQPLKFKVNNQPAGFLDANYRNTALGANAFAKFNSNYPASANVAIGANALSNDTSGNGNTAVGYYAMEGTKTAGGENTAVGSYTLQNVQGFQNSAFGSSAMGNLRTGNFNTALGAYAFNNTTSGTGNTAIGVQSMYGGGSITSISGNYNTAVGMFSLMNNVIGNGAVAIGYEALYSDTAAEGVVAIGRGALYNNINKTGNIAIGDSALFANGPATVAGASKDNIGIGSKALLSNTRGSNVAIGTNALVKNDGWQNTAVGNYVMQNCLGCNYNIALGPAMTSSKSGYWNIALGLALSKNNGQHNIAMGNQSMFNDSTGNNNIGIGQNTLRETNGGNNNIAIGEASGLANITGSSNVFIGQNSGTTAKSSSKLYIGSYRPFTHLFDSLNTLIYGDFAADSLLLNAKTVVRNNAVVRGFTKLGGYGTDVPSIKTKKITGTGPAVNGNLTVAHGLDAAKIISVQIFMQYGAAPTPTKVLPPGYTLIAGYEYQFEIDGANILITNKGANSANIGNKPFRMFITYEE